MTMHYLHDESPSLAEADEYDQAIAVLQAEGLIHGD